MRPLFYSLFFVVFTFSCCQQTDKSAVPQRFTVKRNAELSGFDNKRLQRIDSLMAGYVREGVMPNAVSFVARNGSVIHHKAYGYRDAEKNISATTADIFRWASQTKAIATVVLLTLFEENKFMLDDPVEKFLPMFANPKVYVSGSAENGDLITRPAKRSITVRHLLSHTAGYSYNSFGEDLRIVNYEQPVTAKEIVERIARTPLMHDPGEGFTYGWATDIAGYLAEVISGKTLDVLMKERIFEPLGMNDTYFYIPREKHDRLVKMHIRSSGGRRYSLDPETVEQNYPLVSNQPFLGAGAGLCGTIEDYAKFCQMLLNRGEFNNRRILGSKTVELMAVDQLSGIQGNFRFGMGFDIGSESNFNVNLRSPGSLSWGGLYGTAYLIDYQENMIALLYTNVRDWDNNPRVLDRFRMSVYQAMTE